MNELDAESVAKRLGLPEALIRRLEARGQLRRLALSQTEIRERLYNAHRAFVLGDRSSTAEETWIDETTHGTFVAEGAVLKPSLLKRQ